MDNSDNHTLQCNQFLKGPPLQNIFIRLYKASLVVKYT